jgi:hypothetical protein
MLGDPKEGDRISSGAVTGSDGLNLDEKEWENIQDTDGRCI